MPRRVPRQHVHVHVSVQMPTSHPGVYILEDLGFSYVDRPTEIYGYKVRGGGVGRRPPGNVVEKFKQLADAIARPW